MLAWIVLAATAPALLCLGASAFLAYKDRAQWIWFAAFSLVAGVGGRTVLQTIGAWRLAAIGEARLLRPSHEGSAQEKHPAILDGVKFGRKRRQRVRREVDHDMIRSAEV